MHNQANNRFIRILHCFLFRSYTKKSIRIPSFCKWSKWKQPIFQYGNLYFKDLFHE